MIVAKREVSIVEIRPAQEDLEHHRITGALLDVNTAPGQYPRTSAMVALSAPECRAVAAELVRLAEIAEGSV